MFARGKKQKKKKSKLFKRKFFELLVRLALARQPSKKFFLEFFVLGEAVPAVHRPSFRRLERHFAFLPAVRANSLAHFAWAAVSAAPAAEAATASAAPAPAAMSAVSAAVVISISHLYSPIFFQEAHRRFCAQASHPSL